MVGNSAPLKNVYGRRASGTINTTNIYLTSQAKEQTAPDVVYLAETGRYLAVWQNASSGTTDYDIYGRTISPTGSLITDAFAIAETVNDEMHPRLTLYSTGALVAWQQEGTSDTDLYARYLGTEGLPTGNSFVVLLQAEGDQERPMMVHNGRTRFLTTWQDNRETGWDIYGGCSRPRPLSNTPMTTSIA